MNKPCAIHFHGDAAPLVVDLPVRYQSNVTATGGSGEALTIVVQNAFLIDFVPEVLRTRVTGTRSENPVDFPIASISFIEWFYGDKVPAPLRPEPHTQKGD